MRPVNIGLENWVIPGRIIAVVNPNSSPVKKVIREAGEKNLLINASSGKVTRSAVIMDSGHVVLSFVSPRKLGMRMEKKKAK